VIRRLLFALVLVVACHRAELIENVPTVTSLSSFRTASLVFARSDGQKNDADDALSDIHDAVKERIEGTKVFQSVSDGGNADLLIRVILLGVGDASVSIGVELINTKNSALVGRFQVGAQPDRKGPSTGGSLNIEFDSKTQQAIESAAREIGNYIEDHK
jgi:hypothetical protein